MIPFLDVPLMDGDHASIETMIAGFADKPDAELRNGFEAIAEEIRAHFAREEDAMTEARVPILHCHLELHAQFLREVEVMRAEIAAQTRLGAALPGFGHPLYPEGDPRARTLLAAFAPPQMGVPKARM